jgi:Flp pilus assembly protein TadG
MNDHKRSKNRHSGGQSVVEFAVLLPVIFTLFGAAVDIARVYQAWITLESATRDAAEYVATNDTTTSAAQADAKARVCAQMVNISGFAGTASDCSQPNVSVALTVSTTQAGASPKYPIGTATVTATFPFRTFFNYPLFTQNGTLTISSAQTFSIIQGR